MADYYTNKEIKERLTRARIQMLIKFPFFGTLALNFRLIEDNSIQTAATNGQDFFYNVDFVSGLKDGEIVFLMCHEVMHAALGHIWRRGTRNHEKFNIAADYCIHSMIKEYDRQSDNFKFIDSALYDKRFDGKSTEQIYELLPDKPSTNMGNGSKGKGNGNNNQNSGQGQSQGQSGKGRNNNGNGSGQDWWNQQTLDDHSKWNEKSTQENGDKKAKDWAEKMISAAEIASAKSPGSVPGSIQRLVGELTNPKMNWKELLADFACISLADENFNPPAKRYNGLMECYGCDVVLPDFNFDINEMKDLIFVCDTSGSYSDEDLRHFFGECMGIKDQYADQVSGHVIYCDTKVQADYEFDNLDEILEKKPIGGGGTALVRAFDYIKEKQEYGEFDVSGVVVFTDAWDDSYDDKGDEDYPFPFLFIINSDRKPGKFRNYVKYDPRA